MKNSTPVAPFKIHLALFTVSLIFGINSVSSKFVLREINPHALVVIRISSAALLLAVLHRLLIKEKIQTARDYFLLAWYSIFGIVINQTLFLKGLSMTTAINATVLVTAIPVVTILIAIIMRKEKASFRKISGSILSFIGILVLLGSERIDFANHYFLGNLLVFLNGVSFAIYLVISKDILKRYKPATVVTWNFIFGTVGVLPFGLSETLSLNIGQISAMIWWCVVFLILFASVLVYYINGWALQYTTPSTVAAYIYIQPLIATIISVTWLGETLKGSTVIAAILIFAGVFLVSMKIREELRNDRELDLIKESAALKEE
ncbi:DMT family transporter [bacterium]|nr:DMT family transporter [bacterium]